MIKNAFKNLFLLAAGCIFALLIFEAFLYLYPPLSMRVRGDRIILFPHKKYVIDNERWPKIEERITRSNNSLGFRGEEPPADFEGALTVIALGGSTTEGFYLSDGKTWPEALGRRLAASFRGAWVNNAGMDGHSTFGHAVLMDQYVTALRPDHVILLTGINDLGLNAANRFDRLLTENEDRPLASRLFVAAASRSRTAALMQNIVLSSRALKAGLVHGETDLSAAPAKAPPGLRERLLAAHAPLSDAYAERLRAIARKARAAGIEPILATQPLMCGAGRDPSTGADLAALPAGDIFVDCATQWAVLQLYNDKARRLAAEEGLMTADLGALMPKDSRYYYDLTHFTVEGAEKAAETIHREICAGLAKKHPGKVSGPCPGRG